VPHNYVKLRQPIWVRDVHFLGENSTQIVAATSYHQVRMYDTKAQRRPIFNIELGTDPFTCMAPVDDTAVITATSTGIVSLFDLRKRQCVGSYKGKIAGSIRSVHVHPSKPIFACCGLDRFVRVFDIKKRTLLHKVRSNRRRRSRRATGAQLTRLHSGVHETTPNELLADQGRQCRWRRGRQQRGRRYRGIDRAIAGGCFGVGGC